jgi:hypothetical protein
MLLSEHSAFARPQQAARVREEARAAPTAKKQGGGAAALALALVGSALAALAMRRLLPRRPPAGGSGGAQAGGELENARAAHDAAPDADGAVTAAPLALSAALATPAPRKDGLQASASLLHAPADLACADARARRARQVRRAHSDAPWSGARLAALPAAPASSAGCDGPLPLPPPWALGAAAVAAAAEAAAAESQPPVRALSVAARIAEAEQTRLSALAAKLPSGSAGAKRADNAARKAAVEAAWVANTNAH